MKLLTSEVLDPVTQENFKRIERAFNDQKILKGSWQFFEFNITQAITSQPFRHNFKFTPKDVLVIYSSGPHTFEVAEFDQENIYVSAPAPVVIRAFVGLYSERSDT
jgi:hypothetical protein